MPRGGPARSVRMPAPWPAVLFFAVVAGVGSGAAHAQRGPQDDWAERGRFITFGGIEGVPACFQCHGRRGEGDDASGTPRIAGLPAIYLARQMDDYATGRRHNAIMTPIAQALSEEDRAATAAYYGGIPARVGRRVEEPAPAAIQAGGVLYAVGSAERGIQACTNCHGPAGQGLPPTYPALSGQPQAYTKAQLQIWREGGRSHGIAGVMSGIAKPMSDADMAALAAYLAVLPVRSSAGGS